MKILFTSPIIAYPPAGGPELRIANSIKALSEISDLYVMHQVADRNADILQTVSFFEQYCNQYRCVYRYPPNKMLHLLLRFFRKVFLFEPPSVTREIVNFVKENNVEVIWFGYGNISYPVIRAVTKALPEVRVICDTDSVWSRFISREAPFRSGLKKYIIRFQAWKKRLEERKFVSLSSVTTAVSEVDAEYYRSIADDEAKIQIFSNVVDVSDYAGNHKAPEGFQKPCVYLAGSYGSGSAMNMAADWMLEEVLPILVNWRSDVNFFILGKGSEEEYKRIENQNVTVAGQVESVLPFLFNADVSVVPLQFESGTRFKILEAGACGTPIVSTTLGAEGIPVKHREHLLIADNPEEFAKAIIAILEDDNLGQALAQNCYDLIQKDYSVEALAAEASNILNYINNN
jgi:polysaccharide biosynthesis protein PslH